MTFMRRRGPGELPYNSRQSAPSCLAGRLMSDLGQRLSPAFQPALPYRRVDARVKRFLLTAHHSRVFQRPEQPRSEEHTSELQSLMRISYAVFCLKKKSRQLNQTQYKNTYR